MSKPLRGSCSCPLASRGICHCSPHAVGVDQDRHDESFRTDHAWVRWWYDVATLYYACSTYDAAALTTGTENIATVDSCIKGRCCQPVRDRKMFLAETLGQGSEGKRERLERHTSTGSLLVRRLQEVQAWPQSHTSTALDHYAAS